MTEKMILSINWEKRAYFFSLPPIFLLSESAIVSKKRRKKTNTRVWVFPTSFFSTFLKKVFLLQFAGVSCREHINRINREKWRLKELWNHWLEIYTARVRLRAGSVRPCPIPCFRIQRIGHFRSKSRSIFDKIIKVFASNLADFFLESRKNKFFASKVR